MSGQDNALEVWLECDLGPPCRVGTLAHDRGQIRFQYEQAWLRDARAFAIDPDLSLDKAPFFPKPELGNFGIFLDSSPDRWGQTLMKRREALQAKDEKRPPRTLYTWDFLLGVQDCTRQGGLRFRGVGTQEFLGNEKMAAPPVTTLRELEAVAYQLSNRRIDDLDALRKWLAVLVAPGASLGGARPKANFTDADGSLWIGKFPARNDDRDVGAWEHVVHGLALSVEVEVKGDAVFVDVNVGGEFCGQLFFKLCENGHSCLCLLAKKE
jgi:serine/threonine-protein kinase HipA